MRVFVYGTLLAGEPNHHVLDGARFVCEAKTLAEFVMRDMGFFPAITEGGRTAITGEVYEVNAATLERLDRLEGHPRFYVRTAIVLADGMRVETYLMPAERIARDREVIRSGNWLKRSKGTQR